MTSTNSNSQESGKKQQAIIDEFEATQNPPKEEDGELINYKRVPVDEMQVGDILLRVYGDAVRHYRIISVEDSRFESMSSVYLSGWYTKQRAKDEGWVIGREYPPRDITESKEVRSAESTDVSLKVSNSLPLDHPDTPWTWSLQEILEEYEIGVTWDEITREDLFTMLRRSQSEYAIKAITKLSEQIEADDTVRGSGLYMVMEYLGQAIKEERKKL